MDKISYLKELSRSLGRWMPRQEREDILHYYEEYFEEAGPEKEAQVIGELGAPKELAQRLAEEGGWTKKKKSLSTGKIVGIAAVLVVVLVVGVWAAARTSPDNSADSPGMNTQQQNSPTMPQQTGSPAPEQGPEPPKDSAPAQSPEPSSDPAPSQSEAPSEGPQVLDAFQKVDADISVGDVTICTGAEFQIEIEVRGTVGGEPYQIKYELRNGILEIYSLPKNIKGNGKDLSARVVVTIPGDQTLRTICVNVDVGDANVLDLSAGEIELDSDVGSLLVTGVTADSVDLESDVGDVSVTDTTADMIKLGSDVGDVKLSGTPAATMELTTDTGDITVSLDCSEDQCSYQLSTDVGTVRAGQTTAKHALTHTAPNETYRLTGCSDVGNVRLTFNS